MYMPAMAYARAGLALGVSGLGAEESGGSIGAAALDSPASIPSRRTRAAQQRPRLGRSLAPRDGCAGPAGGVKTPQHSARRHGVARGDEQHRNPKSNIEIAQATAMRPIGEVAAEKLGIPDAAVSPYGRYKAKISLDYVRSLRERPNGKLILVTAITPTPAGEGKTTTTVGLGDALNLIGKKAMLCLREASMGPCFGVKGGAAGGGYAQVVPMEDINLHFTGDLHAIGAANNLLAAMVDNHVYYGLEPRIDPRRVSWRRAIDMNDRALRSIVSSLGGVANGFAHEDGFDITVTSEVI